MNKRTVLILSDSLALPRESPNVCALNDTWPSRLRTQDFLAVHQVSIGGATIPDLLRQVGYYKPVRPDVVVLQAGIVDCAPRFLTRMEQEMVKKIPVKKVQNFILRTLNTNRVRRWRKVTYTTPKQFRMASNAIRNEFKNSPVVSIGILPPQEEYELMLPGVSKNVATFNSILSSCFGEHYLDMTDFPKSGLMDDFHHINADGHRHIAESILAHLRKFEVVPAQ